MKKGMYKILIVQLMGDGGLHARIFPRARLQASGICVTTTSPRPKIPQARPMALPTLHSWYPVSVLDSCGLKNGPVPMYTEAVFLQM